MRVLSNYFKKGRQGLRKAPRVFALSACAVVGVSAIATADNLIADGDNLAAPSLTNNDLNAGTVACDETTTKNVLLAIRRDGSGNVYKNGTSVTISGTSDSADVVFTGGSIALPSNWESLANNTLSSTLSGAVDITPTSEGPGSAELTLQAVGQKNTSLLPNSLTRPGSMTVTWDAEECPPDSTPDVTPPTSSASATVPDGGDAGTDPDPYTFDSWTNQDVTVTLTGSDPAGEENEEVSGLKEIRYTTDGTTPNATTGTAIASGGTVLFSATDVHTLKFVAVDNEGNVESPVHTETIRIDKVKPVITASATVPDGGDADTDPDAYTGGWTNKDVTVAFSCADTGGSGIATNTVAGQTVSAETADTDVPNSGTCTDTAGNVADSATFNDIQIDKTKPVITASATTPDGGDADTDPDPYTGGWTNKDVTVAFSCADNTGGSGIDTNTVAGQTLTSDTPLAGTDVTNSGTCTDTAGNVADPATFDDVQIDKTPPTVTVEGVTQSTYVLGEDTLPTPTCNTVDLLSGVAQNATVSVTPPAGGTTVGTYTVTCSGGTDNAGNVRADVTQTYSVVFNFGGFYRPVDNLPTLNTVKAGSSIPVKFSLDGDQGLNIMAAGYPKSAPFTGTGCSGTGDPIEETVTAGHSSLSYDGTVVTPDGLTGQYNYVWKTEKGYAGTCRQLIVKLIDDSEHRANFKFTK